MNYEFTLTIPAQTSIDSPVRERVSLTHGIVTKAGIFFIPDCAGYAGVRVKHREYVIWPTNPDAWYVRNEGGPVWEESFDLTESPHELVLEGYNEDDSYPHDVQFNFAVMPRESVLSEIWKRLTAPKTPTRRTL